MTDRNLTELAAKAFGATHVAPGRCCGITGQRHDGVGLLCDNGLYWSPLTDDGDALRLAVKVGVGVLYAEFSGEAEARWNRGTCRLTEYGPDDPCAATRRAIVRAAAAMAA